MNIQAIKTAVEKFSFSAEGTVERVVVTDKKGRVAAVVTAEGVEQKKLGKQNLCGALVRNAIVSAMTN